MVGLTDAQGEETERWLKRAMVEGMDVVMNNVGKTRVPMEVEAQIARSWGEGILKDPNRLRAGLNELIEEERHALRGNPDQEIRTWAKKLVEVDRKRSAYQDQQAEGLITLEELRAKLTALEEARTVAQRELNALKSRREHIKQLENDADTILELYAGMVPEALDALTSQERRRIYKMLRLKVLLHADGSTEITGMFGEPVEASGSSSVKTEGSSKYVLTDAR
jgi:hypothetical protein